MLRLVKTAKSETAAISALFVVIAIGIAMFGSVFVWDVSHWYVHRRHLQMQADAAALAGGTQFTLPCTSAANANIVATAREYAGPHIAPGGAVKGVYNPQYGNRPADKFHVLINSPEFYPDSVVDHGDNFLDANSPCK